MIEIIPNWHPIFVHFTVGLYTAAAGFYLLGYISKRIFRIPNVYVCELEVVGRWCLWSAAIMAIVTVLAGWQAYNTVNHDGPSHIAMTNHRNWALPTAGAILLVALWSMWRHYKRRAITLTFILTMLIVQGLLLATAWRGAELVYRYGLGVMSIPKVEGEGHNHVHTENMDGMEMDHSKMSPMKHDEQNKGQHDHAD